MHHIIGVVIGGLITLVLLNLFAPPTPANSNIYILSVVVGAIIALAWPWFIGFVLVRRARSRREDDIQKEVEKQVAQQK